MRSAFLKKQRAIRAFTLHELVIALAVIAILAAVIIPAFLSVLESARASAALETCRQALLQFKIVLTPHNRSTDDFIFRYSNYSFLCRDGSLSRVHISIDGDRISFEPARTAQPYVNLHIDAVSDDVTVSCPAELCPHISAQYFPGISPTCLKTGTADSYVCYACALTITEPFGSALTDPSIPKLAHQFENLFCTRCFERSDVTVGDIALPNYHDATLITRINASLFSDDCNHERSISPLPSRTSAQTPFRLFGVTPSGLTTVYYDGTRSDWEQIDCDPFECFPSGCTIVFLDGSLTIA